MRLLLHQDYWLLAKLADYLDVAGDGSREEKLRNIYAKLLEETAYASDTSAGPVHTIVGAMGADLSCGAVCEGYAKTLKLVMNALAIPNVFVAGNAI